MNKIIAELEAEMAQRTDIPEFWAGDEVAVHVIIRDGEKQRIQVFRGVCIGRNGTRAKETFTVRKISYDEGVERTFAIHSPNVKQIEVLKTRKRKRLAPRAKMYYLRDRKGKI